jgi:hypothetical protein
VVEFPGPLPYRETRALQAGADLLLLWKPDGPGYRTMVPGKTYEYLDAGRPILALLTKDDDVAGMVADADAVRVEPGYVPGVAQAIMRRYAAWLREGTVAAPRPAWLAGHTREALATRLAALLNTLVKGPGR